MIQYINTTDFPPNTYSKTETPPKSRDLLRWTRIRFRFGIWLGIEFVVELMVGAPNLLSRWVSKVRLGMAGDRS